MTKTMTVFPVLLLFAVLLSACGVPLAATPRLPTQTATAEPAAQPSSTPTPAPTPAPAPPIVSLDMIDAADGWAWTNTSQLLRTTDGGQTWVDRTPAGTPSFSGFYALDAQTAWLPMIPEDGGSASLLRTSDGGQTWAQYPNSPFSGLRFTDPLNGWAVAGEPGAGNIYFSLSETHDGGKTWSPVPVAQLESGLPAGTVHLCNMCADSFYYDPSRMVIVYGDMGSMQPGGAVRLQVSFNQGNNWQTLNLPLPAGETGALVMPGQPVFFDKLNGLLPVHLLKPNSSGSTPYDSQKLAFYSTQDGGASWSLLPGVLDNAVPYTPLQVVSAKAIYALCGGKLCASRDGAQTWQTLAANLDFSQTGTRYATQLDFTDASTGWALLMDGETALLYKTADGGSTWTQIAPLLAASAPATVSVDASVPTPTALPTPTPQPSATPDVAFDAGANATRIRFAPYATWVEISDTLAANTPRRYVLAAMKGQIMSVSIPQGPAFTLVVSGADQKLLSDAQAPRFFWRGGLPSTQDYILTVTSQLAAPFTLRIAVNPPGQALQKFDFSDPNYPVALSYSDEFAPMRTEYPAAEMKGVPLLALAYIDPSVYYPTTNLSEASLILAASQDPAVVSTCAQPSTDRAETVTGPVTINNYTFTRTDFTGAATGNLYEQISYRTVVNARCFEVIFLFHSANIGNYSPGAVVEFDRAALLKKFEAVLTTFFAK